MSHVAAGIPNFEPAVIFHKKQVWGTPLGPFLGPRRPSSRGTSRLGLFILWNDGFNVRLFDHGRASRVLFDTGGVASISWGEWLLIPFHSATMLRASMSVSEAVEATRPNRGRLLYAYVTTSGGGAFGMSVGGGLPR